MGSAKNAKAQNRIVGELLRDARQRAQKSQSQIAEVAKLTPHHISALERGISGASISTLLSYCIATDSTPDEVFKIGSVHASYEDLYRVIQQADAADMSEQEQSSSPNASEISESEQTRKLIYDRLIAAGMPAEQARAMTAPTQ